MRINGEKAIGLRVSRVGTAHHLDFSLVNLSHPALKISGVFLEDIHQSGLSSDGDEIEQ
jgi:hypothetical protein